MTDDLIKNLEISEKQAKDYGFYWPNSNEIMKQIRSECKEVEDLLDSQNPSPKHLQEEIGDLMHAVFSLCVYCGFDSKITLEQTLAKFEKRFAGLKHFAEQAGHKDLHGQTMEQMMQYWQKAKEVVG